MKIKVSKSKNKNLSESFELEDPKAKRKAEYQKWSQFVDSKDKDLDEWAISKAASQCNCTSDEIREALSENLSEATVEMPDDSQTLEDTVKNKMNDQVVEVDNIDDKTQLEKTLDKALERNLDKIDLGDYEDPINVWVEGEAGTGKTAIIKKWARENNINLYTLSAASMDDTEIGGALVPDRETGTKAVKIPMASIMNALDRPNSVLFLDELNRANEQVRGTILKLIGERGIPDASQPGGFKYFKTLLFTIVATNPAAIGYNTGKLDMAEKTRLYRVKHELSRNELANHLSKQLSDKLALVKDLAKQLGTARSERQEKQLQGRLNLAKAILSDKQFSFDTPADTAQADEADEATLNARTLKAALDYSDGTKDDFLNTLPGFINPKKVSMIKAILQDYTDIDDKANSALKRGTASKIFNAPESDFEKIMKVLNNK